MINNFFILRDYLENMKAEIPTFSIKCKAYILLEDVKNVKGIHEEELTWRDFERLCRKRYVSERYYDDRIL